MEQNREPRNKSMYLQSIFDKGGMNIQWSENSLFNKCWENWTGTRKQMKFDNQLTPYTRINSKWIKGLKIIHDTIKVLEENIGSKSSDIPCNSIFVNISLRTRDITESVKKMGLHQIKKLLHSQRKHHQNEKGTSCMGKHICR